MNSRSLPRRSLLDSGDLPIVDLARIARRESVRPRDAYQAHRWFARRLSTTARSLLAAAITEDRGDFWEAYFGGASYEGLSVLDPFMGGGVMVLEASRMGADIYGADVEPVAAAISDFQGRLSDLPDLRPYLDELIETAGRSLQPFYVAYDDSGQVEKLLHAFWVQRVPCARCGTEFDAHPQFRLAWSKAEQKQWVACRTCSAVVEGSLRRATVDCSCGARTRAEDGRVKLGKSCCPNCGYVEPLISLAERTERPPKFRMFAVETLPGGEESRYPNTKRRIRAATVRDHAVYSAAAEQLEKEINSDSEFLSRTAIPSLGRFDNRLLKYGYKRYSELFNSRQSLHLGVLAREIDKFEGVVGEALRIAFSDHLATNNRFCAYAGGWRRLTPLFSIRAFRHIARPVELNPWLRKNGRGTFPNAVRSIARASASVRDEREPAATGDYCKVVRKKPGVWDVRCADSKNLSHIEAGTIDLVLTDPPYFDYISYSELGHFYVPWLHKLGVIKDSKYLDKFPEGQLASKDNLAPGSRKFGRELASRFREISRVCKDSARVVFTFQSKGEQGWRALASALAESGIRPKKAIPLFSDSGHGLHKHPNSISWDCVLLCDVSQPLRQFEFNEEDMQSGRIQAANWKSLLGSDGFRLTQGDMNNIASAGAVISSFNRPH